MSTAIATLTFPKVPFTIERNGFIIAEVLATPYWNDEAQRWEALANVGTLAIIELRLTPLAAPR